jgi:hypothetical protein
VIFDVSGSMSNDKVKRAGDALSKFIQTSHDFDEYFLIAFNCWQEYFQEEVATPARSKKIDRD